MKNINTKKGFTIIEVVLVLAIAGLIFLMVFVALPSLQKNQRDSVRKQDLARLDTSITNYISSHTKLPLNGNALATMNETQINSTNITADSTGWGSLFWNYVLAADRDQFDDPSGSGYFVRVIQGTNGMAQPAELNQFGAAGDNFKTAHIVVAVNASCGDDPDSNAFQFVNANRAYAIAVHLESAGVYCLDSD